jgi:CheY-like chemotaxis protein
MNVPLRVLIVEDSEDDILLLLQALRNGGYDPVYQRVEEAKAMRQALHSEPWELVITDHGLPQFDSAGALQAVKDVKLPLWMLLQKLAWKSFILIRRHRLLPIRTC